MIGKFKIAMLPMLLLLFASCNGNAEYDLDKGLDFEMTLFEKDLVFPICSAGPFKLELAIEPLKAKLPSFGLPADALTATEDGLLQLNFEQTIYDENLYKLALDTTDNEDIFVWKPEDITDQPAFGALLPMFKIHLPNQEISLTVVSPLSQKVPFKADVSVVCFDSKTNETFSDVKDDFSAMLDRSSRPFDLGTWQLPAKFMRAAPTVSVSDIEISLPAHFKDKIRDNGIFTVTMAHRANISVGENFEFEIPIEDVPVFLPMSVIGMRDVALNITLVNTLPFSLAITDISVPGDDNLAVTFEGMLAAGTTDAPSENDITLRIATKDHSKIPDIAALNLTVKMTGAIDMEGIPLAVDQGVYLKQSNLIIGGGITLFGNEK